MIYAVYRCLYGEDFIQQSINSIDEFVDKIFVFWDDIPWGNAKDCVYKGKTVRFPKKFDNIVDRIKELSNPKVELIYDHMFNNKGQFTHFVNDIILPNYKKPEKVFVVEIDHVWRRDQLIKFFEEFDKENVTVASSSQLELWKYSNYRIPFRKRASSVLWDMRKLDKMPMTYRQADVKGMKILKPYNHNFGFTVSEKIMYWKHMTALGFSAAIGDSLPNEAWFEDKWLNWHPKTNNKNLEISIKKPHAIPKAYKYNTNELPEQIKFRSLGDRADFWSNDTVYKWPDEPSFLGFIKHFKNRKVLEMGPGNGRQYKYLRDIASEYEIADISKSVLSYDVFKKVKNKHLLNNHFSTLGKKFDVIHFWYVIHHMTRKEVYSLVNFLFNHLEENGVVIFNYPSHKMPKVHLADESTVGIKTSAFEKGFVKKVFSDKFSLDITENGLHFDVIARKSRTWLS